MAKRRRLTLPEGGLPPGPPPDPLRDSDLPRNPGRAAISPALTPAPAPAPPIAQVAGAQAAAAAFDEVSRALADARAEGRLLARVPLEAVETGWLARDRLSPRDEALAGLVESLRQHGQRTPVELAPLPDGRFGLISGWRRITALGLLQAETGEARFGHVLASLRSPQTAGAAYVAMVEENEIRQGLSHFERARIVLRAVEAGAFPTPQEALRSLFANTSRARRSKIGSFLTVVRELEPVLRFPADLPERLGLALARVLERGAGPEADGAGGGAMAEVWRAALAAAAPATAAAEQALLTGLLARAEAAPGAPPPGAAPAAAPYTAPASAPVSELATELAPAAAPASAAGLSPGDDRRRGERARADSGAPDSGTREEIAPGLYLTAAAGRLELSGPAVDGTLRARLVAFLRRPG